jgi:hypothetical protein
MENTRATKSDQLSFQTRQNRALRGKHYKNYIFRVFQQNQTQVYKQIIIV